MRISDWSSDVCSSDLRVAEKAASDGAGTPPQWAGLKFFNVYGPNEYHKGGQASVAWHLFGQLSQGEPAKLFQSHHPDYADGGQLRDFIWVGDCIAVMLWLLDHPRVSGLFHVGTGRSEEHTSELQSLMRISYAVFCLTTPNPKEHINEN